MSVKGDWVSQFSLGSLAFAAAFFVAGQLRMASVDRMIIKAQTTSLEAVLSDLKLVKASAEEMVANREEAVKSARQSESIYAAFLTELVALSKSDLDAQAITQKWEIRLAEPSNVTSEAGPASSGTAEDVSKKNGSLK